MRGMVCGMNADNNRILSLDVFRGITAAMIISQHGRLVTCLRTVAFPVARSVSRRLYLPFLFIMGVAIPVSFSGTRAPLMPAAFC